MNEPKYEYYLKWWGGSEDKIKAAFPDIEQDMFFATEEERALTLSIIKRYQKHGLATTTREGTDVRRRTIAHVETEYYQDDGAVETYQFEYDFGYSYPVNSAIYMFTQGNYSCSCNLSRFIQEKNPSFPDLECDGHLHLSALTIYKEDDKGNREQVEEEDY